MSENDVDDLIGFAWDFMATSKGTVEICTTEQIFRKKVESLVGCAIAKNELLSDEDRDTLSVVYSANKTLANCDEKEAEVKVSIKNYEDMRLVATSDEFKSFIDKQIKLKKDELIAINEKRNTANERIAEKGEKARKIELRLKLAK